MVVIENDRLEIQINPKGAELTSIFHLQHQLEYMWSGDPAFWAKRSPVLFPIVGTLKDNSYVFNEETYSLNRHGFARDMDFEVELKTSSKAVFLLKSNDATRKLFPFEFEFRISYELRKSVLNVSYEVLNSGDDDLFFSVGGHPAFAVPLAEGTQYNDYYLEFEEVESVDRWPISAEGLIEKNSVPFLDKSNTVVLSRDLFYNDAIVLKNLTSTTVALRSGKTNHGWVFDFADFPYLGIWAAKNADFICIEPWCGIADAIDSNRQLIEKEGIEQLPPNEVFSRTWTLELF
jgi:galactose mutarotase-like enzyme